MLPWHVQLIVELCIHLNITLLVCRRDAERWFTWCFEGTEPEQKTPWRKQETAKGTTSMALVYKCLGKTSFSYPKQSILFA